MKRADILLSLALLALASSVAVAQIPIGFRSAVLVESYSFDPGLPFKRLTEVTIPVGIDIPVSDRGNLSISTGYVTVDLNSSSATLADQTVSGALDTQARFTWSVIPGRLLFIANGSIPTGDETVSQDQLTVIGGIASDIIGFSGANLGTGGNVGGGFSGAIPVGRWAIGLGSTYRNQLKFRPVGGQANKLDPGDEVQVRTGIEGPIGRTTYLRVASIYSMRTTDEVAGAKQNSVGDRIVNYLSLNQRIGSTALTIYGFDVFRTNPQIEPTSVGSAILPRGNLVAAGARWGLRVATRTSVTPRAEFRTSSTARSDVDRTLRLAGRSIRAGVDLRHELTPHLAFVLQGDGISGFVRSEGNSVDFTGFRFGLHTEWTP